MRKKYRRTGTVILLIFIAAVVCLLGVVVFIYQLGLRYIKSDEGIKYFGNIDKNGGITKGRLWLEYDSASISTQKFYILELKDSEAAPDLPGEETFVTPANISGDILGFLNESLPAELTAYYPLNNIVFNKSDDRVLFRHETFDVVIKSHEDIKNNNIKSGVIYASDGIKWIMISASNVPASYKDFEIVQEDNKIKKYKGDIFSFLDGERINYASFELKDGTVINLYPAPDIYRITYDKGNLEGDLYIGGINGDFEKDGVGLYYYGKNGDLYYGEFLKDEKTGASRFLYAAGESYVGYIENGKKNGQGIFRWSDGASYD